MFVSLVADPHRAHATVSLKRVDDAFGKLRFEADAEHRLHVVVSRVGDHVHQPVEIMFHRRNRAERIQRAYDEECIT